MSFDIILPFLRPIERFIFDYTIQEICVNAGGDVWVERDGVGHLVPTGIIMGEYERVAAAKCIARTLGDDISEARPLLDSRLEDGSRVAAVMPPASIAGTILAIRKFRRGFYSPEQLVGQGSVSVDAMNTMRQAIADRQNILIAGMTSSGKTTLLNALASLIPPTERIIMLEDTAEIFLDLPHVVRLQSRRQQDTMPEVSIRQLLIETLRLRPDRIILGEVRDGAAFDLLQCWSTGHSGSLSTIHANCARSALSRMRTLVAMAGESTPDSAIARLIADTVNMIVFLTRAGGQRRVDEIANVKRYDATTDSYELEVLF